MSEHMIGQPKCRQLLVMLIKKFNSELFSFKPFQSECMVALLATIVKSLTRTRVHNAILSIDTPTMLYTTIPIGYLKAPRLVLDVIIVSNEIILLSYNEHDRYIGNQYCRL